VEPTLRDATPEDFDFLYELHRAALKDYVEQTWGWDEAWQAERFRRKFDINHRRIIQKSGEDIGCLAVMEDDDGFFISYIALMPDHQGMGIGTQLVKDVLRQGGERGVAVTLRVLKVNPARSLYERLGFTIYETTETHHLMISHPQITEG
jgi:ribosomal protein S18 acetylase RimI-like enzyme